MKARWPARATGYQSLPDSFLADRMTEYGSTKHPQDLQIPPHANARTSTGVGNGLIFLFFLPPPPLSPPHCTSSTLIRKYLQRASELPRCSQAAVPQWTVGRDDMFGTLLRSLRASPPGQHSTICLVGPAPTASAKPAVQREEFCATPVATCQILRPRLAAQAHLAPDIARLHRSDLSVALQRPDPRRSTSDRYVFICGPHLHRDLEGGRHRTLSHRIPL